MNINNVLFKNTNLHTNIDDYSNINYNKDFKTLTKNKRKSSIFKYNNKSEYTQTNLFNEINKNKSHKKSIMSNNISHTLASTSIFNNSNHIKNKSNVHSISGFYKAKLFNELKFNRNSIISDSNITLGSYENPTKFIESNKHKNLKNNIKQNKRNKMIKIESIENKANKKSINNIILSRLKFFNNKNLILNYFNINKNINSNSEIIYNKSNSVNKVDSRTALPNVNVSVIDNLQNISDLKEIKHKHNNNYSSNKNIKAINKNSKNKSSINVSKNLSNIIEDSNKYLNKDSKNSVDNNQYTLDKKLHTVTNSLNYNNSLSSNNLVSLNISKNNVISIVNSSNLSISNNIKNQKSKILNTSLKSNILINPKISYKEDNDNCILINKNSISNKNFNSNVYKITKIKKDDNLNLFNNVYKSGVYNNNNNVLKNQYFSKTLITNLSKLSYEPVKSFVDKTNEIRLINLFNSIKINRKINLKETEENINDMLKEFKLNISVSKLTLFDNFLVSFDKYCRNVKNQKENEIEKLQSLKEEKLKTDSNLRQLEYRYSKLVENLTACIEYKCFALSVKNRDLSYIKNKIDYKTLLSDYEISLTDKKIKDISNNNLVFNDAYASNITTKKDITKNIYLKKNTYNSLLNKNSYLNFRKSYANESLIKMLNLNNLKHNNNNNNSNKKLLIVNKKSIKHTENLHNFKLKLKSQSTLLNCSVDSINNFNFYTENSKFNDKYNFVSKDVFVDTNEFYNNFNCIQEDTRQMIKNYNSNKCILDNLNIFLLNKTKSNNKKKEKLDNQTELLICKNNKLKKNNISLKEKLLELIKDEEKSKITSIKIKILIEKMLDNLILNKIIKKDVIIKSLSVNSNVTFSSNKNSINKFKSISINKIENSNYNSLFNNLVIKDSHFNNIIINCYLHNLEEGINKLLEYSNNIKNKDKDKYILLIKNLELKNRREKAYLLQKEIENKRAKFKSMILSKYKKRTYYQKRRISFRFKPKDIKSKNIENNDNTENEYINSFLFFK